MALRRLRPHNEQSCRLGRASQNMARKKNKTKNLNTFGTGLTGWRPSPFPLPLPPPPPPPPPPPAGIHSACFCIFVLVVLSVPPGYAAVAASSFVTPSDTHSVTHTPTTARCFGSWVEKKEKEKSVCQGPSPSPSIGRYRRILIGHLWRVIATPSAGSLTSVLQADNIC